MYNIIQDLKNEVGEENVLLNEPMNKHTSFKTGGCTDYLILPQTDVQIQSIIQILKDNKMPYYIMGNGTNLLVVDKGYEGAIIQIYNKMCNIQIENNSITAQAGALLSSIASKALDNHLTGFEFASGIPGTLGGAVCMNAGAYGGEMKNILICATVLTKEGEIKTFSADKLQLSYRNSLIAKENMIVLNATLQLEKGNFQEIKDKMEELSTQRRTKQPLNYPSAGSTFKRPTGYFAGKLISDSGLKGYSIGGAQVSEKHAGFVINKGNATAQDILDLIHYVQKTVFEKFGVSLETEVKIIGKQ